MRATWHVYRFHDRVAINPPQGETFYITAEQAAIMSDALRRASDEISNGVRFSASFMYRKPKNANGSRARYFHAYLQRRARKTED